MNQRLAFINYFFSSIKDEEYAFLKYTYANLNQIPETSDIDLLINKKSRPDILNKIKRGENINKVFLQKKSYVIFVSITFNDHSYLEIDLINRFDRKGIVYLNADEVLRDSYKNQEGIRVASIWHHFEYAILFSLLNKSSLVDKHRNIFNILNHEERSKIFAHVCHKYHLSLNVLDELYEKSNHHSKKVVKHIYALPINKGLRKAVHRIRYIYDLTSDLQLNKGITVTFSGVDGAGKSTVLENVKDTLQNKYRQKTVVLRHRPSILPILSTIRYGKKKAQLKAKGNLPRKGKNDSSVSSIFRFIYYYTDYLLGQFYIYFRYTLRGYTVLYDRYYFDFIIDARRSNIVLPKLILKWCYAFVFKPEVNVFLYAPPDVILSRKQELSKDDITKLTLDYRNLFDELAKSNSHHHYISINNTDLLKTHDIVMKECIFFTI